MTTRPGLTGAIGTVGALVAVAASAVHAQAPTGPSLAVAAARGLRIGTVRQHGLTFGITVDSAAGGLVLDRAQLGAFTITGTIRVDGVAPLARGPERAGYADSVRLSADGRVELLVADRAARGPITVEPRGVGMNAGRLLITARGWPLNRVLIVTIDPADLAVTATGAGLGVRDDIRVDDAQSLVFFADSAARPAVIAAGLGRGARGRMQTELVDRMFDRSYGGQVLAERHRVNRIVFIFEPARDTAGNAYAEIVFGLGRSEAEAAQAARGGSLALPAVRAPRFVTPEPDVHLAHAQLAGAAAWIDDTAAGPRPALSGRSGAALWQDIADEAARVVRRQYGRPDSAAVASRRLTWRLTTELFGITVGANETLIAPRIDGAADGFTWEVRGIALRDDSLAVSYRPDQRRIAVRIDALHRQRLVFKLPWLTATSCAVAQRGQAPPETLSLVAMADGSAYVDLRAFYDPARVTVSAAPCGR